MNDEHDNFQPVIEGTPRWMGLAVVALAVLSLVGIGMAWNANSHAHDAAQALATQTTQSKTFQQNQEQLTQRLAQAEQTNAHMQGELNLTYPRPGDDRAQSGEERARRLHQKTWRSGIHAGDQGERR